MNQLSEFFDRQSLYTLHQVGPDYAERGIPIAPCFHRREQRVLPVIETDNPEDHVQVMWGDTYFSYLWEKYLSDLNQAGKDKLQPRPSMRIMTARLVRLRPERGEKRWALYAVNAGQDYPAMNEEAIVWWQNPDKHGSTSLTGGHMPHRPNGFYDLHGEILFSSHDERFHLTVLSAGYEALAHDLDSHGLLSTERQVSFLNARKGLEFKLTYSVVRT